MIRLTLETQRTNLSRVAAILSDHLIFDAQYRLVERPLRRHCCVAGRFEGIERMKLGNLRGFQRSQLLR